jgi:branched-chain amino acid transport system permease protein
VATAIGRFTGPFNSNQFSRGDLLAIRLPLAILLFVPILAPSLLPTTRLLSLAVTATIYVIVANGLHIIFSYAGQLSLAHSTLWGLGAYAAALLTIHFGLPTPVLIIAAAVTAGLGAVMIGLPALRTAGFSFAIVTFAFAEILRLVANNWTDLTEGSLGLTVFEGPTALGPFDFDPLTNLSNFYYLTLGFAYVSLAGVWLVRNSRLGRTFIAIRENEALARSTGTNVYLYKLIAFALSGLFAGVAGVLFLYHQKHIEPGFISPFAPFFTITFLLMILIGGKQSVLGPAIGAAVVVFGPEIANAIFGDIMTGARIQMIFGMTLALSVLTAPNGIAGQAQRGFRTFTGLAGRFQGASSDTAPGPEPPTEDRQ